jgi:hypothetical protein
VAEVRAAINNHAGLTWTIADLLPGEYKRAKYLPRVFTQARGG